MPKYDRQEKYRVIKKGLKSLGLEYKHAAKHDTAQCPSTNKKTMIPRDSVLNKYIVGSIFEFLIDNGYEEEDIKKAFGWK